ncbi:ABC transporter substrate-binding protein [Prescottella equi]|uniref:ABC transporter substrate-binding protein n=1 Tax=Rhodococcus hoagii TaxID=43767 RepID=UPI002741B30F|nr:ABC transporter substrate-binding protein [Prescottella equi]MDP8015165.1 ABC transporter substrate-binding protein [Prescottella equi]
MSIFKSRNEIRDENGGLVLPVRMTRRGFMVNAGVVGLGTMGVGAFLTACGQSTSTSGGNATMAQIRKGGTLTFAIDGTNGVVDPAVYTTLGDWLAVDCICGRLTNCDFVDADMQMGLATGYTVSDDGLAYTFTLRDGVSLQDGSMFTSADVVRSLNRQIVDGDPSLPTASSRPFRSGSNRNIVGVEAPDERTVVIRLAQPDIVVPARLSDVSASILAASAIDQYGQSVGAHPMGAGAFKLASMTPQQSITLEAFDGYYGGSPVIDRLVLQQVADASSLNAGLQGGQIQASSFVVHSAAAALEANPKITVYDTPNRVNIHMVMNVTKGALQDIRVRKAINLCIDRAQIVANAFSGYAEEPTGYVLSPASIGYDDSLADLSKRDVDGAKKLIEEAGATGQSVGLIAQNNNWYPRAAQILEQNLKEIGLVPNVELLDPGSFSGRFFNLDGHELAVWERNGYVPDPDNMAGNMLSSSTSYGARAIGVPTLDPAFVAEIDGLLTQARQTDVDSERKALYTQAQRLYAEKVAGVSMLAYTRNIVASNGATDIGAASLGSQRAQLQSAALTS